MNRSAAAVGSAVFFLVAPGTAIALIPWLLTGWRFTDFTVWPVQFVGALLVAGGVAFLVQAFVRFVVEGIGTPAPVAPPRHLVVGGLYRYVRNPMYVAIFAAILGQALLFGQWVLLAYFAIMAVIVGTFVRFREEPVLRRRFGEDYETYRHAVPAYWPRLRPWTPPNQRP